jgi:hypothetical protein
MIGEAKEIQSLALKYSKPQLARMAQMGLIDTQKAVLAAMMRDRVAKEDAKPPTTTVAQDMLGVQPMAQAQPQPMGMPQAPMPQAPTQMAASGGLTSIPVQMNDYAGGGIIAFDDGGQVKRYDGSQESYVESSPLGRRFSEPLIPASPEQIEANKEMLDMQERQRQLLSRQNELGGVFGLRQQTKAEREEYERNQQELKDIVRQGNRPKIAPKYGEVTPQEGAQQNFTMTPDQFKNPLNSPTIAQEQASKAKVESPSGPGGPRSTVTNLPSIGGIPDAKYTPYKLNEIPTIKEGIERLKEADREAGVDTEIYDKLRGELEGKKGKVNERKQEAIGNALMQAGLGLMGAKQGYEFQTLGESGQKALAGLVASNEKIRDYEDKIEDKQRDLMMAENEYKRTNSKAALNRIDSLTDKRDALEAKTIEEQNALERHKQTIAAQTRQQDISREGNYMQRATQEKQIAAMYRPDSAERAMAQYNQILKTEGKAAADEFAALQNKFRGYDRGQNMGNAKIAIAAEAAIAKQEKANTALQMEWARNPELRAQAVQDEFNRIMSAQGGSGAAVANPGAGSGAKFLGWEK